MSTYPEASLKETLDRVFNTESVLFIDSSKRDTLAWPASNNFQFVLPIALAKVKEMVLTHFIMNVGGALIPGGFIYVIVSELQGNNSFMPGASRSDNNFIVVGGAGSYVSSNHINDISVFPRQYAPDIHTITVSIVDGTGALVAGLGDFTMRLYVRSRS